MAVLGGLPVAWLLVALLANPAGSVSVTFAPPVLLGSMNATVRAGSLSLGASNESKLDNFFSLGDGIIIGQYGDAGQFGTHMPIMLSRDSGRTWTSPATVPCVAKNASAVARNASLFQCFSGDSIVYSKRSEGALGVRTLGLPTPDSTAAAQGRWDFVSQSTEYAIDNTTGKLTIATLDRRVRFVGTPTKPHAGCWVGTSGFSWSTGSAVRSAALVCC